MASLASSAGGLELLFVLFLFGLAGCGVQWLWVEAGAGCLLSPGAPAHTGMSGVRVLHLGLSWPQEQGAGVTSVSGLDVTLPD